MRRAVPSVLGLALSLYASGAHADLTVFYATDGPTGPLVATVGGRAVSSPAASSPALAPPVERAPTDSAPSPSPRPAPPETQVALLPVRPQPRAIRFVRVGDGSGEDARLVVLDAAGAADAEALDRLSVLARPRGVDAPETSRSAAAPGFVAPGVRRLHPGLLLRIARLAERFPDRDIEIVSGYRPDARTGSRHRHAEALDLRVRGESPEIVRAFLSGLPETGVGFYPTSGFVHVDVRARSVQWTDASGPGEAPRVVRESAEPTPPASDPASADSVDAARRAIEALDIDLHLGHALGEPRD